MFSLLAFSACLQIKLAFVKVGAVKIVNKLKQILQDLIWNAHNSECLLSINGLQTFGLETQLERMIKKPNSCHRTSLLQICYVKDMFFFLKYSWPSEAKHYQALGHFRQKAFSGKLINQTFLVLISKTHWIWQDIASATNFISVMAFLSSNGLIKVWKISTSYQNVSRSGWERMLSILVIDIEQLLFNTQQLKKKVVSEPDQVIKFWFKIFF